MKLLLGTILFLIAVCPEPQFLPLTGLDQSKIVNDVVTGEKALIGRLYAYTNQPLTVTGNACDPDNEDPNYPPQSLRVWREPSMTELPVDPNGDYQLSTTYATNGWHYETVVVTDGIVSRKATIAIFTRTNKPPVIGCGGLR